MASDSQGCQAAEPGQAGGPSHQATRAQKARPRVRSLFPSARRRRPWLPDEQPSSTSMAIVSASAADGSDLLRFTRQRWLHGAAIVAPLAPMADRSHDRACRRPRDGGEGSQGRDRRRATSASSATPTTSQQANLSGDVTRSAQARPGDEQSSCAARQRRRRILRQRLRGVKWSSPTRTAFARDALGLSEGTDGGSSRPSSPPPSPRTRAAAKGQCAEDRRPTPTDAAQARRPHGRERDRRAGLHGLPRRPPRQAALGQSARAPERGKLQPLGSEPKMVDPA